MKDIDFDELDRAVSSVLGQGTPKDDDSAQVKASNVPEQSEDKVTYETPAQDEKPATQPSAPSTPLAVKRRGKFMDVMHPSADMAPSTPASAAKPPRGPAVLKPLSTAPVEPVEEPAVVTEQITEPTAELDESHSLIGAEPTPVESMLPEHVAEDVPETPVDSSAPEILEDAQADVPAVTTDTEEEAPAPVVSLYVDPLEMKQPDETETEEESVSEEPVPIAESAPEENQPLQATPFLTDTKVDKRPLGAFGEADATTPETDAPTVGAPADTQAAPTVPLPRELQPDVVEVESSVQETEVQPTSPAASEPFAAGVKAPSADDGRVEGHPLFDTSTYHEPIAAVHGKGMPGWAKWLIGLLVCLALGAGVGYFLFTAGL